MKIIRADVLGFCMGVRRAVDAVEDALHSAAQSSPQQKIPVYTIGPLIHNKTVLSSLASRGVRVIDNTMLEALRHNAGPDLYHVQVVVRAHGVPPQTRRLVECAGAKVIDATCPRVLANQKKASHYASFGYTVFIAGDPCHGEVISLAGFAEKCIVVQSATDAAALSPVSGKAVLISQTTIKQDEYDSIAAVLRCSVPDITVLNTICPATAERQQALRELCGKVDGVVVVGSADSANTMRLYTLARQLQKKAWLVESAESIPSEVFSCDVVGLTAGASAPESVIAAIEKALQKE